MVPDSNIFLDQMESAASGYDVFDAIAGAPGTYVSYDTHGQMSYGFSRDLYLQTMSLIDYARAYPFSGGVPQSVNGSTGYNVTVLDLGTDVVTSGPLPDLIKAFSDMRYVFSDMPTLYQEMYNTEVRIGVSQKSAAKDILYLISIATDNRTRNWAQQWGNSVDQYGQAVNDFWSILIP